MATDKQKGIMAVCVALAVVAIIWFFLRSKDQGTNTNGNYLSYNAPAGGNWSGSAGGLPSIPASVANNDCGCNSNAASGNFFGSLGDMLSAFSSSIGAWIAQVDASMPSNVSQYQNNPANMSPTVQTANAFNGVSTTNAASYALG